MRKAYEEGYRAGFRAGEASVRDEPEGSPPSLPASPPGTGSKEAAFLDQGPPVSLPPAMLAPDEPRKVIRHKRSYIYEPDAGVKKE